MAQYSSLPDLGIYFGRYPDEETLRDLRLLGVTTIINLTESHEMLKLGNYRTKAKDFQIIYFPIVEKKAPSSYDAVKDLLAKFDPRKEKIYIHCKHGKNRTGTILGACLSYFYQKDYKELSNIIYIAYKLGHGRYKNNNIPRHKEQIDFLSNWIKTVEYYNKRVKNNE